MVAGSRIEIDREAVMVQIRASIRAMQKPPGGRGEVRSASGQNPPSQNIIGVGFKPESDDVIGSKILYKPRIYTPKKMRLVMCYRVGF